MIHYFHEGCALPCLYICLVEAYTYLTPIHKCDRYHRMELQYFCHKIWFNFKNENEYFLDNGKKFQPLPFADGTQLKPEMNTSMYIVILVRRLNTDKDIWAIQKKEA